MHRARPAPELVISMPHALWQSSAWFWRILPHFVELPAPIENLVSGRSAIMFAILAGVSTTLIARSGVVTDRERLGYTNASSSCNRLAHAGFLLLIGLTLPLISAGQIIILSTYAVLFLLAIPVLRLSTRAITILAAITAFATPLLSFWLRTTWPNTGDEIIIEGVPIVLSFTSVEGTVQAFHQLPIDGMYPPYLDTVPVSRHHRWTFDSEFQVCCTRLRYLHRLRQWARCH